MALSLELGENTGDADTFGEMGDVLTGVGGRMGSIALSGLSGQLFAIQCRAARLDLGL